VGDHRYANLPTYSEVRYRDVWPGIDLAFRSQGGKLKYEFLVDPGADPSRIHMTYAGADPLGVDRAGALVVGTPVGQLRDSRPITRQNGGTISSNYAVSGTGYGFALSAYDRARPLVIDPGLAWSTLIGGTDGSGAPGDDPKAVTVDSSGNTYIAGDTSSPDFPTTAGAYEAAYNSQAPFTAFISKLNANGTGLVYSTFLGGSDGAEAAGIAVDGSGNAYIVGDTSSSDFPTTPGTDRTLDVSDAFITKLDPSGSSLVYSTFLGGSDYEVGSGIAIDSSGNAYVAGVTTSGDFPLTAGAPDTSGGPEGQDSFVAKLSGNGRSRLYSTYLGGTGEEASGGIAVDGSGNAYVTGSTQSADFPTTPSAFDRTLDAFDAYVTEVNATGTTFVYSTYLGGSGFESAWDVAVDGSGNAYAVGGTSSSDFPTTPGGNPAPGGLEVPYVAKVNVAGSALVYSTSIPDGPADNANEEADAVALDSTGSAYVLMSTNSPQFPVTDGAYDMTFNGGTDLGFVKLSPSGTSIAYATYLGGSGSDYSAAGGIAVDAGGNAYMTGSTGSTDFPVTAGALQTSSRGNADGFVLKLDPSPIVGYPRPKGATPLRASLVPAYAACATPNTTHGSPLAFGSCAPPQQASSFLTVGSPDANGQPVGAIGSVRYDAIVGDPSDPRNEADVRIATTTTDVRRKSDLSDYQGELQLVTTVRLTDHAGDPGGDPLTVQDFDLPVRLSCFVNSNSRIGSFCNALTTINVVLPGAVTEARRTILALGPQRVYDGGADADADTPGDNTLFLTQGVFVP
jgi:hypothetical protein